MLIPASGAGAAGKSPLSDIWTRGEGGGVWKVRCWTFTSETRSEATFASKGVVA